MELRQKAVGASYSPVLGAGLPAGPCPRPPARSALPAGSRRFLSPLLTTFYAGGGSVAA